MTPGGRTPWGYGDFAIVVVAGIVGSFAGTLVATLALLDPLSIRGFTVVFAGQVAGSLGALGFLGPRRGTGDLRRDLGLVLRLRDAWGLPAGVGLQFLVALAVSPLVRLLFPDGPPEQTIAGIAANARDPLDLVLLFLAVVVVAPVVEETIYRGLLLRRIQRSFGTTWAVIGSAAVFALVHLFDPNALAAVPGLFLVGLALAASAVRFGDLGVPIFVHAGVNLTGVVVLVLGDRLVAELERLAEEAVEAIVVVARLVG